MRALEGKSNGLINLKSGGNIVSSDITLSDEACISASPDLDGGTQALRNESEIFVLDVSVYLP